MRKKLNSQSKEDIRRKSSKILKKLLGLKEFKNSKTVGFFLSKPNEVDSTITFQSILGTKEFSVPVMDDGIKLVSFNSFENLIVGDYDILEPKERSYLDYVPELLVIPGVAFDLDRNRLGNGKGFYDRFL